MKSLPCSWGTTEIENTILQTVEITTISADTTYSESEMVSKGQSMTAMLEENPNIEKLVCLTSDVVNLQPKISYK